ncbi:centrosomal protein of 44 kDa isoform X2 [Callithrix jacchus]|uniref:Centrosomal protein of 44 kDa n=2 Tax=Callithrix jacchus TaxID=9483 RepID=U3EKX5_CALJA|nr:centrosomal protein of 44 kDa isoform X2 [Callithrix jacchus]XP_054108755.1 centrosomal protein of 44 kDa isoform X2 [Callithrix jacchus]XP_054108756.1 centrosomal protein of 44 kDa isoform X2 [Callithrix jacchus]XP_054108757.1 centrosomal protein of 44 kDa isoform X2 [Callithrix jacchus]XP_054108758.1 centrosomal protein of 44 kDa isoform X2 [Callithrix jacchus]XP_054108760.1 centrosomal protein of 44 kDa isoform X2 [Callithrix jacchus]XP_054108761.1 centrosomal protein of 44 kDa isoform 
MATGDLKRSLRNLEQVLRLLNYPEEVDCVGLIKGDTAASLPIISYSFTSYSPYVTELIMESNVELIAKNDLRFIDAVYKLLRDQFNYKPILTKKQFIQCGFAERKIQIVCDILNCVMKKHKELSSLQKIPSQQRKKISSAKSEPPLSNDKISAEAIGIDITGRLITSGKKKAVVIRHLYIEDNVNIPEDTLSAVTEVNEAVTASDLNAAEIKMPEIKVPEIEAERQDISVNPEITALQTMLAECQENLKKLTLIEKRLDCLEQKMKGKVMVDEKTWTNLLSRVTLLETEMLLSKKSDEFNEISEDYTSCSNMNLLNPHSKSKVERPASIPLSSGYSKASSDSTPRTSTINYCGLNEISEETTIQKMERMKKMFEETAELLKCSNH